MKEGRFRLDIRKKFITMRVVRPWPRKPQWLSSTWQHSRPGWMGLCATWSGGRGPCSTNKVDP